MQKANFPFAIPLRVRYSEIDAQGIVYNSHYLTYYDIAITETLRLLKFDYSLKAMQQTGKDFHTVKATVEYHTPLFYDDEFEIRVRCSRIGRASLTWQMAIFLCNSAAQTMSSDEKALSTGEVIWVYVDMNKHKSTPLPEELVRLLKS